jgi:hypothetical protein
MAGTTMLSYLNDGRPEREIQRPFISAHSNCVSVTSHSPGKEMFMERRHFLRLAVGIAAGAAAIAATAEAAPLSPQPLAKHEPVRAGHDDVHPAVTSDAEVERLKPEEVRWGHHWHHRWHHWHRRWHRHHWRRWHRRHW